jgi:hypothetical protein
MQIIISSVEKLKYPHMNIKYGKNHRDGRKVTLNTQLEEDVGPVILLNKFTVKPDM